MPGFIGPTELIFFGVVALLILGPKRLPEMGRSLGRGMREFKDSVSTPPSSEARADETDVPTVAAAELTADPVVDEQPTHAEPVMEHEPVR